MTNRLLFSRNYIGYLIQKDLAFYCDEQQIENFPVLNTEWIFPGHITNCILDARRKIEYLNQSFLMQLEALGCKYLQIRFYNEIPLIYLEELITLLKTSSLKNVELVIPPLKHPHFKESLIKYIENNRNIKSIVVYNSLENDVIFGPTTGFGFIRLVKDNIHSCLHCGVFQIAQFSTFITHYTESINHNTCLNRKVSIDENGEIKNCPSMKESYGNINDTTLEKAINRPGFKKYWNITKDQISVCKDCEFRHVCTDCRAYLEDPNDELSKPLKCGYNPYTSEWEEWSEHPLKQKAIDYYGMRELVKTPS